MLKLKSKKKKISKNEDDRSERTFSDLEIRPVSKMAKHRSFAFYGRAGTGKTTLCSTFPSPILHLDIRDKGTDSIVGVEDMDSFELDNWDDFETIYWELQSGKSKYKTLAIDTVTMLQQLAMEKVLEKKKKSSENAGKWGAMTKQDWGDVAALMKTWIINIRDLPLNTIFLAQDRVFNLNDDTGENESDLEPEVGPRLSPSISSHLNAAVSVLGNTFIRTKTVIIEKNGKKKEKKKQIYCLRLGANETYITKVRKPKDRDVPSVIEDPSFDDIMLIIKGE